MQRVLGRTSSAIGYAQTVRDVRCVTDGHAERSPQFYDGVNHLSCLYVPSHGPAVSITQFLNPVP